MRKSGFMLLLLLARANAQQPSNLEGFTGVVRDVSVETSGSAATLSIESGTGHVRHQIHCTANTQITKNGKPVPLLQLKKGQKVECSGTPNGETIEATTCTVR